MTKITTDIVEYLAKLSKLSIEPDELAGYADDLSSLVGYVDKLQEIDTSEVEPTYQVTGLTNVARSDEVVDYDISQAELLKNASDISNNLIKTPKALG